MVKLTPTAYSHSEFHPLLRHPLRPSSDCHRSKSSLCHHLLLSVPIGPWPTQNAKCVQYKSHCSLTVAEMAVCHNTVGDICQAPSHSMGLPNSKLRDILAQLAPCPNRCKVVLSVSFPGMWTLPVLCGASCQETLLEPERLLRIIAQACFEVCGSSLGIYFYGPFKLIFGVTLNKECLCWLVGFVF